MFGPGNEVEISKSIFLRISHEHIGHFRNVRGLGKSMVVFRFFFEKLRYSNERSTKFESL